MLDNTPAGPLNGIFVPKWLYDVLYQAWLVWEPLVGPPVTH
ncbi:hypothetical protein M2282_006206 [Variovorax boronicumulans]|nr:hypothetical protein [Variovorax boronicumulans]MDH6171020.1 hypothetical protein [Variovorax boronicumulans]